MRIVIEKDSILIAFESTEEKSEFLDSKVFKKLTNWISKKDTKKVGFFDLEKWKKEHPNIWNPIIYPIPNQIQDPPIDVSPHIDDPVRFPSTTEPYTEQRGGCDATPKFDGCDATPRYGKATVDWPSKYPCDATPEFLKTNEQKRKSRK